MENHIKTLRKNAGFKTAKEVATILEISSGMVYQMEEGIKTPSQKLGKRMAELYKCSMDDIFLHTITTNSDKNNNN